MKITYKCKICGEDIYTSSGLSLHIAQVHKIPLKEYYDRYIKQDSDGVCIQCGKPTKFLDNLVKGYNTFCSNECRAKFKYSHREDVSIKCECCGFTIKADTNNLLIYKFSRHLKNDHNLTSKEYYDKYLKKPGEGICKGCGKPTTYHNFFKGYREYCSGVCAACKTLKDDKIYTDNIKEKLRIEKETKEEKLNNYIQELKDRVHEFDWNGERNSFVCGKITKCPKDKNNMLTDNSMTYIDGQEYSSLGQTITSNTMSNFDNEEYLNESHIEKDEGFEDVFWL